MSNKTVGKMILLAVLMLALLCVSGCGSAPATTVQEPSETAAPATEPTKSPEEIAAEKEQAERQERLASQQDGFLLERGYLYAVDENGDLICDDYIGVLYFGENGRYTSGSKDLDRLVASVIRKNTEDGMTRMEMLRKMYEYTRDNINYIGFGNHYNSYEPAHGKDGWMVECATYALENEIGNCYHFAAEFAALARGIGYQAYAASGVMGGNEQQHGWVEILDENGKVWYCDPETEYSRIKWLNEEHDLFYKSEEEIGQTTGIDYLKYIDPFEAERIEAEERSNPAAGSKNTGTAAPSGSTTGTNNNATP